LEKKDQLVDQLHNILNVFCGIQIDFLVIGWLKSHTGP